MKKSKISKEHSATTETTTEGVQRALWLVKPSRPLLGTALNKAATPPLFQHPARGLEEWIGSAIPLFATADKLVKTMDGVAKPRPVARSCPVAIG